MRPYEIVLLGATGFTGRLTARHLASTEPGLRWALAGRRPDALEAVRAELAGIDPALATLPLLTVDVTDAGAVHEMAAQTRVVLTTAGPFDRYGPPVVEACVAEGTDYVDITGEPPFVAAMIRAHHEAAADKGLRIVSACGLDSIPYDLGAWFTVQQLPRQGPITLRCVFKIKGGMSGGTWTSALEILKDGDRDLGGLVDRSPQRRARGLKDGVHCGPDKAWRIPLPTIDPLVVLRSARILDYGPDFRYGHYLRLRGTHRLLLGGAGLALVRAGARIGPVRRWLQSRRPPGTGPSEAAMDGGFMQADFHGVEGDHEVRTRVVVPEDPGYRFTAKMVSAAALCLARDRASLPAHTGVIPPAAAMAVPLQARLEALGMKFSIR